MSAYYILLVVTIVKAAANVDIFNKCPDFRPLNISDVKKVYHFSHVFYSCFCFSTKKFFLRSQ